MDADQETEQEYCYDLKIPKDRIAVLIGTKGSIKSELESDLYCRINIDSKDGDVNIRGKDSFKIYIAKDVIRAIARGFNPEIARLLIKPDYSLELILLPDYSGKSKKRASQLKARVIGTEGKARKKIESLTQTNICIYGKTVGIIGQVENTLLGKRAIEKILQGSTHANVFKWLEKKYRMRTHKEAMDIMGLDDDKKDTD